jgi:transcriptional regulator with XRE-family HTH domain
VTLKSLRPELFPNDASTLGEHIKARRLALKLLQREAAAMLGVTTETVLHWEKGQTEPPASAYPAILAFLGYDPFPEPRTVGERLKAKRRVLGLSIEKAALVLGVDPGTLGDWEAGKTVLYREHRTRVAGFLGVDETALSGDMARAWAEKHAR